MNEMIRLKGKHADKSTAIVLSPVDRTQKDHQEYFFATEKPQKEAAILYSWLMENLPPATLAILKRGFIKEAQSSLHPESECKYGDKVYVINSGERYGSYNAWAAAYMPEGAVYDDGRNVPSLEQEGKLFTVVAAGYHFHQNRILYGIMDDDNNFSIYTAKGICPEDIYIGPEMCAHYQEDDDDDQEDD